MAELTTLGADASVDEVVEAVRRDGGVVVADVMSRDLRKRVLDETSPWVEGSPEGRDDFSGFSTTRTGALVARSPACRQVVMHPMAVGVAESFLSPYTNRIQLHLTQIIRIKPGQKRQPLHRDRLAWGGYIPREIEPQLNTIWALTDFTTENGATRLVPGSHAWPDEQRAEPDEIAQAAMGAGSVLFYSGSIIHGGGENRSDEPRSGLNITYCLAWLRTEENQFLSCPPHIAKDLDPELQELLGYTMGNYALGYYSEPESQHPVNDILPPEIALGRKPRERADATNLLADVG
jgi:ectoine hydroxylase-related dioxygenase (phytanoyl-CoA dioxygenase family)